ncbi:hypothetical protein [Haloquadratum walsbyi]|uniref:Uncharacterized protein n=1 Tax=Haloquadratum walsbyi (strain DSM 16854 / JCM 12705 / C23) TaxID=768065 RepID=G0LH90_HALWC|nr:hypothetical protein [Haloquadratum walsbyi]CCC40124.1 uncharacterized protein Hqrw_2238 [Haloquadratum walsbyi C23]
MSLTTTDLTVESDHLTSTNEMVYPIQADGHVTASYPTDETAYSRQCTRDMLTRLMKHEHVWDIYAGLSELADNTCEETDD